MYIPGNVSSTVYYLNATRAPGKSEGVSIEAGYVGAAIAVLLMGSAFVPVKKCRSGDGLFFQWVMCTSIFIVGNIVYAVRGFPKFYPLGMLGGTLWATGNLCVVTIFKTIGMGLGILIWANFNMLGGWASGRFGWFHLKPEIPSNVALNYAGVVISVVSSVIYFFIKTDIAPEAATDEDQQQLLPVDVSSNSTYGAASEGVTPSLIERLSPLHKRLLGTFLAIFSGILYGLNFAPVIYIQNNTPGASQDGLDYVISHFTGIFLSSSVYFISYCILSKNRPSLYPRAVLPAMVCGSMWAGGQVAWFVANDGLSEAVSFPIISAGPAGIAALWATFAFKEIRGLRNYILLVFAILVTIAGVTMTAVSKM